MSMSGFRTFPTPAGGISQVKIELREFQYRLVDVFAERPFTGSSLAVFTDARGLTDETMQAVAQELNRAQTAFVFPSADVAAPPRVRVFTPREELPRAEYPTIGTAFALELERGSENQAKQQRVVFESGDGQISVSSFARVMTVRQPVPELGPEYGDTHAAMAILGLTEADRMQGVPLQAATAIESFLVVPLRNRAALERIRFRMDIWERTVRSFLAPRMLAFTRETDRSGATAKLRVFSPSTGILEDAATESACAPLSAYLVRYGFVALQSPQMLLFEQGAEVGRPSYLHVALERNADSVTAVRVGGQCVSVGTGSLWAPFSMAAQ
jgi:trans-2,3-dihydro-3-hydroxyanthranilate isomerase